MIPVPRGERDEAREPEYCGQGIKGEVDDLVVERGREEAWAESEIWESGDWHIKMRVNV